MTKLINYWAFFSNNHLIPYYSMLLYSYTLIFLIDTFLSAHLNFRSIWISFIIIYSLDLFMYLFI